MSTHDRASSADEAINRLKRLPPIADMGISFVGILPDSTGALGGQKIDLSRDAQADIAAIAQDTHGLVTSSTLLSYGATVLIPPQHWMYVLESDAAVLADVEAVVRHRDFLPFDAKQGAHLKMIAARFTATDQRAVTFYRIADSLMQLKPGKMLGLLRSGETYSRLEPTDVLLIRTDFDVVVVDGYAFFRKKATFEKAFGFLDKLKAESRETFNTVVSDLKIDGIEVLREACTSQPQMMAKMSSIRRSMEADADYAAAMTMPKLLRYIEEHPHVDIDVLGHDDDRQLVFDPTPKRRFQILKLLDDDFLHSVLTERDYEAASKVQTGPA